MISSINQNSIGSLQNLTSTTGLKYKSDKGFSANEESEKIGLKTENSKNMLQKVDLVELRKYAGYAGESNITDDDIRYGLLYGRSVIADYLA